MPENVSRRVYLGADPGAHGAVVSLHGGSKPYIMSIFKLENSTLRDLWDWLKIQTEGAQSYSVLEKVGGYIGEEQPGSRMFNFGASYGRLEAYLTILTSLDKEIPRTWQAKMKVPKMKGEKYAQYKSRLKARAQELWPDEKVTLATADALLLATYCKRKHEGSL